MKVLYVYEHLPKVYQTYMSILARELKKKIDLDKLSYSCEKVSDIKIKSYGIEDSIQRLIYKLKLSKFPSLDLLKMSKYDIVHIQHSFLYPKVKRLKEVSDVKLVVTLRGGDTYVKPWISEKWFEFYKNHEQVDFFVVMSNHQKEYLSYRWQVPKNKIAVVPISHGLKKEKKSKLKSSDKLKLVSVYRMTWEKSIVDSIKFASILKNRNIDFSYDFYGDGHDLGQLYFLVDKYKLEGYINIHGKVKNSIIKKRLLEYDFLVQFSISEAFPTTVLEAQSIGLPCLVSNAGGLPESVIDKHTGLVNHNDDLDDFLNRTLELWNNQTLYQAYSSNAFNYVNNNFSVENEINSLKELYQNILN